MKPLVPERPAYLARLEDVKVDEFLEAALAQRRVPLGLFRARAAWAAERAGMAPADMVERIGGQIIAAPPGPVYLLAPSIQEAVSAPQKIVALFGPARTGKTRGICMYVYEHVQKYSAKYAGDTIRWLFVRDTYESIRATTLKSFLELFPPPKFGIWNEQQKTYRLRLPQGQRGEVKFIGLDGEVGQLQSMDLTGFVIEEPAGGLDEAGQIQPGVPEHVYRSLVTRLSHPPAMILDRVRGLLCGNTGSTAHWTFRVFRPDLPQPNGDTLCVHVPEEESPVPAEYYEGLTRDLGEDSPEELRYRRGAWLPALTGGLHWGLFQFVSREQVKGLRLQFGATCDPAAGGAKGLGDRSAIVVAGFTPDGTAYVFDIIAGRFAPADLLARIYQVQVQYGPQLFAFEAVAFAAWLSFMIEQEQPARLRRGEPAPPILTLALPRNSQIAKDTRIQGSLGVRLGSDPPRLYLVEGVSPSGLAILREELAGFGQKNTHDDVLDALSDLDAIARMPDTSGYPLGVGEVAEGQGWQTEIGEAAGPGWRSLI